MPGKRKAWECMPWGLGSSKKTTRNGPSAANEQAYTSSQKAAIENFRSVTNVDRSTAARFLRSTNWNAQQAISEYYNGSSSTQQANTGLRNVLSKTFDHYREDPSNQPDTVGMMGMSKYLDELGVSIEDIGMLVVSEIVKCPSMGEMGRSGFVNGWTTQGAETIEKQRQVISRRRGNLGNGATFDVFKGIYKHTFAMAVQPPARAVPLENAVEFWRTLLSDDGWKWSTETTPWLDWWIEYLERDWKKSVNRDMWDQTLVFAQKARADEDMSFWDEMGAWPGVIDEFVSFVKEKREAGGPMEE